MNCLHLFDGVAINELIFTQQHITILQNALPSVLVYEMNARQLYIHSIFPSLKVMISQNLSADVIHQYSRCFPLAVPSSIK